MGDEFSVPFILSCLLLLLRVHPRGEWGRRVQAWGGKLTLSTQLIKPKFMLRTLTDTTPTFIRNWTFNSGGSTRSSTHPGPKAMFTLYRNRYPNSNPNPNPNYTGWLWRWHENFSLFFSVFIRLSSKFAGWLNLVFRTIVRFLAGKWRHKIDSKILFQLMASQIGNFEVGIETNAKIWKTQLL